MLILLCAVAGTVVLLIPFARQGWLFWTTREVRKQAATFNLLRYVAHELDNHRVNTTAAIDPRIAERTIASTQTKGLDAWGRRILFHQRRGDRHPEFVLISFGRDGRAEYGNLDAYFELTREYVSGYPDRDLVFRNGEPIRSGFQ